VIVAEPTIRLNGTNVGDGESVMDFSFSDEQHQLRASLRAFLGDHYGFAERRAASRSPEGWWPDIWRGLATDLGLFDLAAGPAQMPIETMIVMEEFGDALVGEPFLETVVIAGGLLREAGGAAAEALRAGIVAGDAIVALAWAEPESRHRLHAVRSTARRDGAGWRLDGRKVVVSAAPWASQLLVTARIGGSPDERPGIGLFIVDPAAPGVRTTAYPTIDGRRAADILLEDVHLPDDALIGAEGGAIEMLEKARDAAIAAIGAEAVGVTGRMLQDTIDFTRQRRQFGVPIATFQALRHRMADMFIRREMAMSAVYLATLALERDAPERARAAATAKVAVGEACRFVGQNAIQLHGGMGMADETAVTHYFRRATVIEAEFGTVDCHLARLVAWRREQGASRFAA